jgi:hypothetical protein
MKVNPVFDTNELKSYFYEITNEIWDYIEFKPKTYLNAYIYKKDTSIETIYSGMSGKKTEIPWQDRTKVFNLKSGVLYYIYFDYNNAYIGENDYLHTYAFVSNQNNTQGFDYYQSFKNHYPKCKETLWFSYMKTDTEFDWHIDGDMYRYHQILSNDGITPSFSTEIEELYFPPSSAFIEYVNNPHRVLPNKSERLHLIASMSNYE